MAGSNPNEELFPNANSRDIEAVGKQFKKDGKQPVTESNASFIATAVVGIPLFLAVLPITVVYQLGKSMFGSSSPSKQSDAAEDPSIAFIALSQESTNEKFPEFDQIVPKDERKYDAVLLGCTGFTGRLAAIYIAKTYGGKVKYF